MTTLNGGTIDFGRADQQKNMGGVLATTYTIQQHVEFLDKLKSLALP